MKPKMGNKIMNESKLAKIAISVAADEALTKSLKNINQGFDGGRITKAELATWCILQTATDMDASAIEEIRQAHFNQISYLESMLKRLKSARKDHLDSEGLTELQSMLSQQNTKKKTRRKIVSISVGEKSNLP